MPINRGKIWGGKDNDTGLLELNFDEEITHEHNRKFRCAGHMLDVEEVELLKTICERYLEESR